MGSLENPLSLETPDLSLSARVMERARELCEALFLKAPECAGVFFVVFCTFITEEDFSLTS